MMLVLEHVLLICAIITSDTKLKSILILMIVLLNQVGMEQSLKI